MALKPLFDPQTAGRPMRVAAFMSGSGTNILRLLERQASLRREAGESPFEVVFIFSDRQDGACQGERLARQWGLPYLSHDIRKFHDDRGARRSTATVEGLALRREFDQVPARAVAAFGVDLIALGGYMSVTTLGPAVNVHPADLSLRDERGRRRFVGDNAVREAILAGERELRSSTILTDAGVDSGPLLLVSTAVPVELPAPVAELRTDPARLQAVVDEHQARLKEAGDWVIFPRTIELIAAGRLAQDEAGLVYLDGRPVPQGVRP